MTPRNLPRMGLAFALGVLCTWAGGTLYRREACGGFALINPDYACGRNRAISKAGYSRLDHDLRGYIDAEKAAGKASKIAVYFRDLREGPIFGINENDEYAPASLLKLPMVLAYFDYAEENPSVLEARLVYKAENAPSTAGLRQKAAPVTGFHDGQSYPIEELMKAAISQSDNTAYGILVDYMNEHVPGGTRRILRTFQEVGVIDPRSIEDEVVTVRGYASLFRLLYNVSYLSAQASEKLLSWLAASSFDSGLAAGVPPGLVVANKFGERDLPDGSQQVHDCGIVYFPDNPYSLCVMTRGKDWDTLVAAIAEISRMVYQEVDSRRGHE